MNNIENLKREIETELCSVQHDHSTVLDRFYIGKTGNIEYARERHEREGYTYTVQIGESASPSEISNLECLLINYFRSASPYRNLCMNDRVGGGNDKADKLYLSVSQRPLTIYDIPVE